MKTPVAQGCEDKRLEIDLEGLRENLWFDADGNPKDDWLVDMHDKPRWIDTSAMICDPLTKAGSFKFANRLNECMKTGIFDTTPTPESVIKKMAKQKQSQKKIDGDGLHESEFTDKSKSKRRKTGSVASDQVNGRDLHDDDVDNSDCFW